MAPKNKQPQELSASGPKDKVSFVTAQNGIKVPANREQPGLSISLKEYDYIKDKIGNISCKSNNFSNWKFASIGVFFSAVLAIVPFIRDAKFLEIVITGCVMGVAIIAFFILRFLAVKYQADDETTKNDVVKHMDLIKDRFYGNG